MIRRKRLELGLSQKDLSKKLKVDRSYISKLENKEIDCNLKKLILLSKILNLDIHDLIDWFLIKY